MELREEMPPTQNISAPHLIGAVSVVEKKKNEKNKILGWGRGEQACSPNLCPSEDFRPYSDYSTHGKPRKGFKDGDN